MGMLVYKKMSLFDAPAEAVIVHASNATTGWGAGIAKEFSRRYPRADREYRSIIELYDTLGKFLIFAGHDDGPKQHMIGTLVTSRNKGKKVDSIVQILHNTESALNDMMTFGVFQERFITTIYSNKFNSGLFRVPWKKTSAILEKFCEQNDITWIVCDPDLS